MDRYKGILVFLRQTGEDGGERRGQEGERKGRDTIFVNADRAQQKKERGGDSYTRDQQIKPSNVTARYVCCQQNQYGSQNIPRGRKLVRK